MPKAAGFQQRLPVVLERAVQRAAAPDITGLRGIAVTGFPRGDAEEAVEMGANPWRSPGVIDIVHTNFYRRQRVDNYRLSILQ